MLNLTSEKLFFYSKRIGDLEAELSMAFGVKLKLEIVEVATGMPKNIPSIDEIIFVIAQKNNLTVAAMKSKSRKRPLVDARAMCYALIKEYHPTATLGKIAEPFGRDHSTIITGLQTFNNQYYNDLHFREKYNDIKQFFLNPINK